MFGNEFPPLGGGTGVVNSHLLTELSAYPEVWVDLVTSSRSPNTYEIEPFAERITLHKVPVDNRNIHHATNRELIRYGWRGLRVSRKLLAQRSYDLSFAFSGVPAGAISYALKLTTGLPYLLSLQGPDVPGFEARYNWLYPALTPVLRRIWRAATVVTAMSAEQQCLAHRTVPSLNLPIIANAVDLDTFHPPDPPRQAGEINIVCVGRLIERKGQHHLLHAFAALRAQSSQPLRLTLVGTGDAERLLRRLVAELHIADAVTFTGFVSHEALPAVYRQADIFVLPSQNEGMSIALLEALASGLPVIVTDTGGTAELVQTARNGFICAWADVPALTAALRLLIQDPRLRHRMGARGRQIASRFSWSTIARQYLDLCMQVAALPQSSRGRVVQAAPTTREVRGE